MDRSSTPSTSRGRLLALVPSSSAPALEAAARAADMEPTRVDSVQELLDLLDRESWSVVLLSLDSPGVDEALAARIAVQTELEALLLAAERVSLDRALLMERVGAVGIVRVPIERDQLEARLEVLAIGGAAAELPPPPDPDAEPSLVGSSPALAECLETLARVAGSSATVLVTGESGTGKELVARSLHSAGSRPDGPFVAVNCAAIPEQLLESELFGHERGAFTGAVARRVGRFERASGGTLFLDEIGDMSAVLQARILRALEDRTVTRVGGNEPVAVDVRVVAATNQDLAMRMAEGAFREDLYHRLAVVEMHLPPLRERSGDIRELALHFAASSAARHERPVHAVSREALHRLETYGWPGNVRELRNVMERAVLLATGTTLRSRELRLGAGSPSAGPTLDREARAGYSPSLSLEEVEARHIQTVLGYADGHIGNASETLGIHRNTLSRKMQEYGIDSGPVPDGNDP